MAEKGSSFAAAAQRAIAALLGSDAKKATVYLSPREVVSVCRRFKPSRRSSRDDFVLKIGAPNYIEREFLRCCKAAGEPVPVRKVQLRMWPKKR